MLKKCETPRSGGVSRNSCAGLFRDWRNSQVQPLTAVHNVRSKVAAMIVTFAFREGCTHG